MSAQEAGALSAIGGHEVRQHGSEQDAATTLREEIRRAGATADRLRGRVALIGIGILTVAAFGAFVLGGIPVLQWAGAAGLVAMGVGFVVAASPSSAATGPLGAEDSFFAHSREDAGAMPAGQ